MRGRVGFERRTALPTTLTIANSDIERDESSVRDTLLGLGRRGGYVTHIERGADALMLRARVPEGAVEQS